MSTALSNEYSTGYFMPIKYFAPINDLFTGSVSITCNLILICLVVFRSTKEMRIYSKILILNALVDLQYTISVLVTQPAIDFDKGVILMMQGGPFRLEPNPITWHMINWYVTSLFSCVMFLPIPFIFRYFAVCRMKILNFWQFSALVIVFLMIALGYGTMHGYTFYPFNEKLNISSYKYIINAEFWKDEQGRLPVYVVADLNKEYKILILVSMCCFLSSFSYTMVIFCNVMIYKKLKEMQTTMSKKTREVQKQLNKVLQYQALVPFLICVLPLGFVLILCALRVRTAGKGLLLPIILAWIPVLNPLAAIVLVKEYRTFFTRSKPWLWVKSIVLKQDFNEMMKMNVVTSISRGASSFVGRFKTRTAQGPSAFEISQF